MRKYFFFLTLLAASMTLSLSAHAHKVVASAWLDEPDIEGEVGLSNGEMALEGTVIEVLDSDGNKLGETQITTDGLFRFTPTKPIAHHFYANLGAGHVTTVVVAPDELPEHLQTPGQSTTQARAQKSTARNLSDEDTDLKRIVAKAVRREIQPLRKEIASYKEKNDLQSILGGIGYILGLTGIVFYLAAKRKEDKAEEKKT